MCIEEPELPACRILRAGAVPLSLTDGRVCAQSNWDVLMGSDEPLKNVDVSLSPSGGFHSSANIAAGVGKGSFP